MSESDINRVLRELADSQHEVADLRAERDRYLSILQKIGADLDRNTEGQISGETISLLCTALAGGEGKPEKPACISTHGLAGWPPASYRDGEYMVCGLCGERVKS